VAENSEVITIRVPKGTKAAMKRANINLSEDVRGYLEAKSKSLRLNQLLPELRRRALKIKVSGDSSQIIRQYRDAR